MLFAIEAVFQRMAQGHSSKQTAVSNVTVPPSTTKAGMGVLSGTNVIQGQALPM